ncbi:MAG: hypothetical protein J0G29_06865 [Alphaproteobacteria bacterium]|nr:hypothetical protein [Alphaproteobacteria bacterium]
MKTPLGRPLENLPSNLIAAIEHEMSQLKQVKLQKNRARPLYQMAAQAIDNIAFNPSLTIIELVGFLKTDTLLYICPTDPAIYQKQQEIWFPIHQWFKDHLGIIIPLSETIAPPALSGAILSGIETYLKSQSIFSLSGIQAATHIAHSLLIAILINESALDADNAFKASLLEELTQNEKWGTDELAQTRQDQILEDLKVIEGYFGVLG